jgi:hypothetical protein
VYLLTDGAVYNTEDVVKLVRDKAIPTNTRIHTFGVGSGASTDLVKNVAKAGLGTATFITNNMQIEEEVVNALCRPNIEVKVVKEVKGYNSAGDVIPFCFYEDVF